MAKQLKTFWGNKHFISQRINNPVEKVSVMLVGCGGTGSQMAMNLARINVSLLAIGHPGIHVSVCDPDEVTIANVGRQLFSESEIGMNKALAMVSRINRFFGFDWKGYGCRHEGEYPANILITCVDSVESRFKIAERFCVPTKNPEMKRNSEVKCYWLDTGNDYDFGQVVLGSMGKIKQPGKECVSRLPNIFDLHPNFSKQTNPDSASCSLAQALQKQDLFVNSMIATSASHLLWKLFTKEWIDYNAIYLNLSTMKINTRKL